MMRCSLYLILLSFVVGSALSSNVKAKPATSEEAMAAVNVFRDAANLPLYTHSNLLRLSAEDHANYIALNAKKDAIDLDLHNQRSSKQGFTGINASARSGQTSYASRDVKENISFGNKALEKSLEGLMSAIYHRFTFLDFLSDNLGYGTNKSEQGIHNHVFNMGRKDMENVCRTKPKTAEPISPIDCLGTNIKPEYLDNACYDLPEEALYHKPFKTRCSNGQILKAEFMESVCAKPPKGSLFDPNNSETGAYYPLCDSSNIRIDATWFDNICSNGNHPAQHSGDNRYYEICDNDTKVNVSWFQNFCDSATPIDVVISTDYYKDLCQSPSGIVDYEISSTYRDELDDTLYRKSPDYVVWPPEYSLDISPVFYEEIPDPLPDYDVSGYPLSLQFNPGLFSSVKVSNFILESQNADDTWSLVKNIRELNKKSDPNRLFSALEFAWFPLQRLDWGTNYRASASARTHGVKGNNVLRHIYWKFRTKDIYTPLVIVNSKDSEVKVPKNEWFTLYHPPTKEVSRPMVEISAEWNRPAKVISEIIDMNTIRMKFENNRCNPVVLSVEQRGDLTLNPCH